MTTTQQDLALFILRFAFGISILFHGGNKISGGISGTASWFESIGMRQPRMQAVTAATTEIIVGLLLIFGLLTEFASAGLIAVMIVAIFSAHLRNGYFIFRKGEGWEYCFAIVIVALALGLTGPGKWSLDNYFDRTFFSWRNGIIACVLGVIASGLQLTIFWRPQTRVDK